MKTWGKQDYCVVPPDGGGNEIHMDYETSSMPAPNGGNFPAPQKCWMLEIQIMGPHALCFSNNLTAPGKTATQRSLPERANGQYLPGDTVFIHYEDLSAMDGPMIKPEFCSGANQPVGTDPAKFHIIGHCLD